MDIVLGHKMIVISLLAIIFITMIGYGYVSWVVIIFIRSYASFIHERIIMIIMSILVIP